ncbi:MAG TPA: helix-turn-helix transcriptional regulator [Candidatus Ozemobacteraceae bacterium]
MKTRTPDRKRAISARTGTKATSRPAPKKTAASARATSKTPAAHPAAKARKPEKRTFAPKSRSITRQKRVIEGSWMEKPWPVERIRGFMSLWGMTQAEFAIFCGVSYDTVTSWSRGRRNLVRVDHAGHIECAEKAARKRKLTVPAAGEPAAPWAPLRTFVRRHSPIRQAGAIPANLCGTFQIVGVEMHPAALRLSDPIETVTIGKGKGRSETVPVTIIANGLEITLEGRWRELGGARLLELIAPADEPCFFGGHAGCITPGKQNLRINLWPADARIPMRLIAIKA